VFAGKYDEAIELMRGRMFRVWEGGSLDVADHWANAHLLRGEEKLAKNDFNDALADFQAASTIPDNLPSDNRRGGRGAEIAWWTGLAYEGMGNAAKAKESWQRTGDNLPQGRRRGGDAGGISERQVQLVYEALAKRKLGQTTEAETLLRSTLETAQRELSKEEKETTAVATPAERRAVDRIALAHYVAGLAQTGLGNSDQAREHLTAALARQPDQLGAKVEMKRGGLTADSADDADKGKR
jgi:tetratricopeptide (TPR) repeat protein